MHLGLYIHIPFCGSRCPYCDFSFVVRQTRLAPRYARAVVQELGTRVPSSDAVFDTVYFGGGTPSEVPPELLGDIIESVHSRWSIAPDAEITIEANPDDARRFTRIRRLGVNRLSIGVQALDDADLKALGRRHTAAQAESAYLTARDAGFDNVNLDLMFGAPRQTVEGWRRTLDRALALEPEHLSVYGLTVEPGTAFFRRSEKGRLPLPAEDEQARMYSGSIDCLQSAGYAQYEISNFARPGFESRHNLSYWERRPYLGVGQSAHSFLDGTRTWNVADLTGYLKSVEAFGSAVDGRETIAGDEERLEQILLGMRRPDGLPEVFVQKSKNPEGLERMVESRLLERSQGRIRLTRDGLMVADLVCAELAGGV